MTAKVLKKEGYKVTMELLISPEDFKDGINRAYTKTRGRYSVQGFRKGKAPRYMIERVYGEGVFYDEAINILFPEQYEKGVDETGIYPVDHPSIDLKEVDPEKGIIMTAEVDVKPEVKLGRYKGVEIEDRPVRITAKDVDQVLEAEAKKNSRLVTVEDRPVQDGDITIIDFEGFLDGEAFEGGKEENHELTIGSKQFIPGFEEQIIARNAGDEFEVNVTFPEDYQAEELKGKDTVFKVKLHEIKQTEIPAIDDEFAMDVSEFDTLDEYKEDIKKNLREKRTREADESMKDEALGMVVENAELDVPPAMVERRTDGQVRDFETRLKYQGMELDQYLGLIGMEKEGMREKFRESSLKQVKAQLVIETISAEEKIEATEEELEAKIEETAKNYGMKVEDYRKNLNDEYLEYIKDGIVYEKTIDFIYDNAVKIKKKAKPKKSKDDEGEKE